MALKLILTMWNMQVCIQQYFQWYIYRCIIYPWKIHINANSNLTFAPWTWRLLSWKNWVADSGADNSLVSAYTRFIMNHSPSFQTSVNHISHTVFSYECNGPGLCLPNSFPIQVTLLEMWTEPEFGNETEHWAPRQLFASTLTQWARCRYSKNVYCNIKGSQCWSPAPPTNFPLFLAKCTLRVSSLLVEVVDYKLNECVLLITMSTYQF